MQTSGQRKQRRLLTVLVAGGVVVGLFALLFATANDDWIVISIPSAPWKTQPSAAAFEARLWAIMLVSFIAGAALCVFAFKVIQIEHRRTAQGQSAKVKHLESEIENLNRLLEATMNERVQGNTKAASVEPHGGSDD